MIALTSVVPDRFSERIVVQPCLIIPLPI
jgi:hypothetical protein